MVLDGRICTVSRLVFEEQLGPYLGIEWFQFGFVRS
jgi:hypothetical protein